VWSDYSTRDAAQFVGLPESAVRRCVRAGFVAPDSEGAGLRFSFRDLLVLKTVKSLNAQGVSLRRIQRQLIALARRLEQPAALASLSLSAHAGHVIVRDQERAWRADTGQLVFEFVLDSPEGRVAPLPVRQAVREIQPIAALTADEWLERAVALEEDDPDAAKEAYRRALRLRPDCSETLIDLGRLYAETGELDQAADCFRRALELDPGDATALYNLGVVAQDEGDDAQAIERYRRALDLDPRLAEAHYNLATIYDRAGEPQLAIRHINEYRKLTRAR
jgi:tetratricopeptide (TPR) repeat protein